MNYLLTLLTLGAFLPWAKTRVRRYVWASTQVESENLTYDGQGRELFFGYLISLVVILPYALFLLAMFLAAPDERTAKAVYIVFAAIPLFGFVLPFARYRGLAYLLSRTTLRGVRFSLGGSALNHAVKHALLLILVIFSCLLLFPYYRLEMWRDKIAKIRYGNEPFILKTSAWDLVPAWLLTLLLAAPTAGLSLFFYLAYETRYVTGKINFQNAAFGLEGFLKNYVTMRVVTFLMLVLTLGLAYPWVLVRRLRFWVDHLGMEGDISYEKVSQSKASSSSVGDGILSAIPLGI